MSQQLIKEPQRMPKLPLPTTKVDFPRMTLKNLSNKPKSTKMLMRKSESGLKPRMLLKAIAFQLNTLLKMKNSRTSLMPQRRLQF
jgi:hypothetical protein